MRLVLSILGVFILLPVFSQVKEYGSVSVADLQQIASAGDTTSAIILFDKGSAVLEPNSTSGTVVKRHLRLKIIRKEALKEWGDFKFTISREAQLKVKGATYNLENGVVVKSELENKAILKSRFDKNFDQITFAFPNVREGSILEFTSTYKNPDLIVPSWDFQYSIPVKWSEYSVSIPVKGLISYLSGGLTPTEHESKYEGEFQRWLMKDVPAFTNEPSMPNEDVYRAGVDFAVRFNSWPAIYSHLLLSPQFMEIVNKHGYLKSKVEEITTGFTDPRQKVKIISNYVKQSVKFNDINDFYALVPTELLRKKEGSVGDINLLLASMLEKAGFKVSMVLLSTRGNGGLTEKLTSLGQFDYVICEVTLPDGQNLLVDATQRYLPYDMIPPDCLTHKGFLVTRGKFGWVAIEAPQAEKISVEANFTVSETGGLKGTMRTLKDGYKAYDARVSYFDQGEKDYKNHFIGSNIWTVEKSEILNMENLDKPVVENYTLSTEGYATVANDLIYLNPHIFLREESNPFISATRTYPVDLKVRTDNTVMFNITIPEGYKVEEMPQNKVLTLPGNAAKCTFSFTQTDNKITAMSKLQFNKTLFEPFEYAELKEFYSRLVDKKAETIVLKKQ